MKIKNLTRYSKLLKQIPDSPLLLAVDRAQKQTDDYEQSLRADLTLTNT